MRRAAAFAKPSRMAILVGCSGFRYDDWRGAFYPPSLPAARMLEAYAEVFPALEVNATYYRTPPPSAGASMVRRAAGRLQFALKGPGELTHRRQLHAGVVEPFLRFAEPFAEAGVLLAVLLQFPGGFRPGGSSMDFLARALDEFRGLPCVAELRHASWDAPGARAALAAMGANRAHVDQPGLDQLSASPPVDEQVHPRLAYFRFHGRNSPRWFANDDADRHARYRYRYGAEELQGLAHRVAAASDRAQTTAAFFNNHPDGAAPNNAESFAALAGAPLRGSGYRDLFS